MEANQHMARNNLNEDVFLTTFLPKFYFFYGSLMDPGQLTRVLGLIDWPVTVPASITGYSCKMWGPYPALIDGPTDGTVQGVAFEVKSQQVATRLAEYETDAYVEHGCIIQFENGDTLSGVTFKWADGADDPDLSEGSFNLREWKVNNER
jgi:cation transport regulator ChaC